MTSFRQRGFGAILVAILAVLPVSGPLCSALCAPTAHAGHGSTSDCHDFISDGAVANGASDHDCGRRHGPAGDLLTSVSATRADVGLVGLMQHLAPAVPHGILGRLPLHMRWRPGAPTASPPPTRTPLVLRI